MTDEHGGVREAPRTGDARPLPSFGARRRPAADRPGPHSVTRVPHYARNFKAVRLAERKVKREGRRAEYVTALAARGLEPWTADPAERCRTIFALYPESSEVVLTTGGVNDVRASGAGESDPPA